MSRRARRIVPVALTTRRGTRAIAHVRAPAAPETVRALEELADAAAARLRDPRSAGPGDRQAEAAQQLRRRRHANRGEWAHDAVQKAIDVYRDFDEADLDRQHPGARIGPRGGRFVSQGPPDVQGVLADGRCLCFEIKSTTGPAYTARVPEHQLARLERKHAMDALVGILLLFRGPDPYQGPPTEYVRGYWLDHHVMGELARHAMTEDEAARLGPRVPFGNFLDFLWPVVGRRVGPSATATRGPRLGGPGRYE